MGNEEGGERTCASETAGFYTLPEGCISNVLSLTTPEDACRLSLLSRTFRSAADSDSVWKKFLPPDYQNIIVRSVGTFSVFSSKKQIYLHLCDHPLIIDGGKKSFSLEKQSGIKCYMLAARDLKITWADTPEYWDWISLPDSRFAEVAILHLVWWLEIRGKISASMLSPDTNYAVYLVFKLTKDAYGFKNPPAEVSVGIVGDDIETQYVCLDPNRKQGQHGSLISTQFYREGLHVVDENVIQYPKKREDGWLEVELGEFLNKKQEDNEELEISIKEVKGGEGKGGLIVQGIEIRPKKF